MYHYLDDKEFEKDIRNLCGGIMQNLCHILKEDYDIGATFYMVGSGSRKLITQNGDDIENLRRVMDGEQIGTLFVAHKVQDFYLLDYITHK